MIRFFRLLTRFPLVSGIIVAVLVRCLLFYPGETGDTKRYIAQSESLLSGQGFGRNGVLDVQLPPGYPVFLAAVRSVTTSPLVLRVIQVALSVVSCILVYQAVKLVSRKNAVWALLLMAVSPVLAHQAGYILSEVFSVFLMSLLVVVLALEESRRGRSSLCSFLTGVLGSMLILTAPATAFFVGLVSAAVLFRSRLSPVPVLAMAIGIGITMLPWQLHCVRATGRPIATVYDFNVSKTVNTGFGEWVRTWLVWPHELRVFHFRKDLSLFDRAPADAFASDAERNYLREMCKNLVTAKVTRREFDAEFAGIAARRRQESPRRVSLLLPLQRMVVVWIYMDELWPAQRSYVGRLAASTFNADRSAVGTTRALFRYAKAGYSTVVFLLTLGYAGLFSWLCLRSLFRRRLLAAAIVLGVFAYTVAGALTAMHESRRNAVFYPALILLIGYGPRKDARGHSCAAVDAIKGDDVASHESRGGTTVRRSIHSTEPVSKKYMS